MSDSIKHECGIALMRLRKPFEYYIQKYGSVTYAPEKMYLLMEKQKNRGQDGAGVANIKIKQDPGYRYISRYRSIAKDPIGDIFTKINKKYSKLPKVEGATLTDLNFIRENFAFMGDLWLGHLRYGTYGKNNIENCHPILRQNNWRSRSLAMAGNFNMTNSEALFQILVNLGQHPKERSDTVTVIEKIGHFLDEENQYIFNKYKTRYSNNEIAEIIADELDLTKVLKNACRDFDGGYTIAGLTGSGSAFVARDPSGIRPAYFFANDEVIVVASEKPAIKTAFDINYNQINEIKPGHALIINRNGEYSENQFIDPLPQRSCSFERIYFSRGTDPNIYYERKELGKKLVVDVLEAVDFDLENTIFSFIPNTAETAFLGMIEGLEEFIALEREKFLAGKEIQLKGNELMHLKPRVEKLVIKDVEMRTFITDDESRDNLISHVYDSTYEVIRKDIDTLVIIDDSIVRGATLEMSILTLISKLQPKKVVVVSSAPQVRYPDCYGIDMSKMYEFVAFRALIALLESAGKQSLLDEVYLKCKEHSEEESPPNFVKILYEQFTDQEITVKITEILKPKSMTAKLEIIYQSIENLHKAIPLHLGDWYFTGNYPTSGGFKIVNKAFTNFMEGKKVRAY